MSAAQPESFPPPAAALALDQAFEPARRELLALLQRMTAGVDGSLETPIEGLYLHRLVQPTGPKPTMQNAALAVIAQGSKRLFIGDDVYEYDPFHYLVSSVDLPVVAKVSVASPDLPYLGLRLELNPEEITALISDANLPPLAPAEAPRALCVNPLGGAMLDVVLRMLRLLDTPRDIPILGPMVKRELLYRLLMNGQGAALRLTVLQDSQLNRVAKAIRILRDHYAKPLRVEDIARDVHMSVSSLHHHFKQATAMSPLQYQKQLRLQEARRLMLTADAGVALAARAVGYESSSQFSREYSRLFGTPPLRDKQRWKDEALAA
ncbi:AraC family transcriptional regulator [Achromobacter sp. Marseille-Q4962]|uniref:AraC family transcriptional regulator n=1 Tax=Achromobacter sp. Marseille-Q4962 TaxID=2942202 RepID=UPI0020749C2E|nr:AraC family transcriptional regulator [Achromobacter sp. Marseille-Q4962]